MRLRWGRWLLTLALWACVAAPVQAQTLRFAGIPIATDLRQVPVGAWSRYRVRHPLLSDVEMTVTLLGRDRTSATLEVTIQDWPSDGGHPAWTFRGPVSLAPLRVERKHLVRDQTVQVPAGTFQAQLFRTRASEATAELWASANIHPLGVAQLQSVPILRGITVVGPFSAKAGRPASEPMGDGDLRVEAWQLLAQGTGGRSVITKRPRPFDAEVMRNQALESIMSRYRSQ